MNSNRVISYLTVMVGVLTIIFSGLGGVSVLTIIGICAIILVVVNRGYFYFVRANRIYSSGNKQAFPQAIDLYKQTLKAGISPKFTIMAATILIQEGEGETGRAALEKLLGMWSLKEEALRCQAKSALSVYWYTKKDYEKALSLCQECMGTKYRDNVLYINTCSYLLALEKAREFKRVVEEFSQKKTASPALLDLQIVYQILEKDYSQAYFMLEELFSWGAPFTFADPYVHMAQVWMHYGNAEEAMRYLKMALDDVQFRDVTIISRDFVKSLLRNLEKNPIPTMAGCDKKPLDPINGRLPHPYNDAYTFADPSRIEEAKQKAIADARAEEEALADKDPDTSLNEDDEAWLERH